MIKANKQDCGCGGACSRGGLAMHGNKFRLQSSTLTYRVYDGRKHIVVPVIMARADVVMNDALTPAEELIPESWNGVPVTSGHPVNKGPGDFISANQPTVLPKWEVGRIFNARMDGVKLKAEAWIDIERVGKLNPALLSKIEGGHNVDVSTGFFSKDDDVKGALNGRAYSIVTRDLKPDHLALLINEPGACSWADGCGLRANIHANVPPPDQPRDEGRWTAGGAAAVVAAGAAGALAATQAGKIAKGVKAVGEAFTKRAPLKALPAPPNKPPVVNPTTEALPAAVAQTMANELPAVQSLLQRLTTTGVVADRAHASTLADMIGRISAEPTRHTVLSLTAQIRELAEAGGLSPAAFSAFSAFHDVLMGAKRATGMISTFKKRKPRANAPPPDQPREEGRWSATGAAVAGVAAGAAAAGLLGGGGKALAGLARSVVGDGGKAAAKAAAQKAAATAHAGRKLVGTLAGKTFHGSFKAWANDTLKFASTRATRAADTKLKSQMSAWVAQVTEHTTAADLSRIFGEVNRTVRSIHKSADYSPGAKAALQSLRQFARATLQKNGIKVQGADMGKRVNAGKPPMPPQEPEEDEEVVFHPEDEDTTAPVEEEDMPVEDEEEEDMPAPVEEEDTVPPAEKLPSANRQKVNKEVSMTDIKAMVSEAVKETVTVTLKEIVANSLKEALPKLISADQQAALKLAANQAASYKDGLVAKVKANTSIPEEVIKTFTLEQLEATAAGVLPPADYSGRMVVANAHKLDDTDPAIKAMTAGETLRQSLIAAA